MAKEWVVKCKDCDAEFGYSHHSFTVAAKRGESRPERCADCRRRHNAQTSTMALPYFELRPRRSADPSSLRAGALGSLPHPSRPHSERELDTNFDTDQFGMNDDDIVRLVRVLRKHQVAVLVGPTGSGKSTFLPYRLVSPPAGIPEDEFTRHGQVLITQPRIQATRNIPAWVAQELLGSSVGAGFDVGFRHSNNPYSDARNRLVYVTDGTLINWIINGQIANLSVIMIDEAHERSTTIDLILGLLKRVLPRYPNLRLIIASATIDTALFLGFFDADPEQLVECTRQSSNRSDANPGSPPVSGDESEHDEKRVRTVFRGQEVEDGEEPALPYEGPVSQLARLLPEAMSKKIFRTLQQEAPGDVLGFLHGKNEINSTVSALKALIAESELADRVDVYPLYTELSQDRQNLALLKKSDPSRTRVVITTNVCETSLTVPNIAYVVDSGLINLEQWDVKTECKQVRPVLHSRHGCLQRHGRTGRTRPGVAYCLYTEEQWNSESCFRLSTPPQVQRSSLEQVILSAKAAGIDDLTQFDWIERPPEDELARAERRLRERVALDESGDITEYGLELQVFADDPAIADLMIIADRHNCVIEMATVVAMMKTGLAQLLTWDGDWDPTTRLAVTRIHEALRAGCRDDIEFCLKIYAAWSESRRERSFAASWAFGRVWSRSRSVPEPTPEMKLALSSFARTGPDDPTDSFMSDVRQAVTPDELVKITTRFGLESCASKWLDEAFVAMDGADCEAWALTFFVNHSLLKNKVKPQREQLIDSLSGHKKEDERRRIDFDLVERVRLIFAFCMRGQTYTSAGPEDVPLMTLPGDEEVDARPVRVNQDSVCFDRVPAAFIAARRQVNKRRLSPVAEPVDVVHLSMISAVESNWLDALSRDGTGSGGTRSAIRLATLIAAETRDEEGDLRESDVEFRLFLDQRYPIGSRVACTVIDDEGPCRFALGVRVQDPTPPTERVSGATDDSDLGDDLETSDSGELADTVLRPDQLSADPDADEDPAWLSQLREEWEEEHRDPLTWQCPDCKSGLGIGQRQCPECGLDFFPTPADLRSANEGSDSSLVSGRLAPSTASALKFRFCRDCSVLMPPGAATCSHCHAPLFKEAGVKIGQELICGVEGFDFDDPAGPTVLLSISPREDPFTVFCREHTLGTQVHVVVAGYAERRGDPRVSLVVVDPISEFELLIEPGAISFPRRGSLAKQIPLESVLSATVDAIDDDSRRVTLSLLDRAEEALANLPRDPSGLVTGYARFTQISFDRNGRCQATVLLDASEPAMGSLLAFEVEDRGLPKPLQSYLEGERYEVRLSSPRPESYSWLDHVPNDVANEIGPGRPIGQARWEDRRLYVAGRFGAALRRQLLALSNDEPYARAVNTLYRNGQPKAEILDGQSWEAIARDFPPGTPVTGTYVRAVGGGVLVQLDAGFTGYLPDASLAAIGAVQVGDTLSVHVDSIDLTKHSIRLRAVMDPLAGLAVGARFTGAIQNVVDFGAFVQFRPGVNGLIRRNDLKGWPAVGDQTTVEVLTLEAGQFTCTMRLPENTAKPPPFVAGQVVSGYVKGGIPIGVFVNLAPGVQGMVHESKFHGARPNEGDEVSVRVLNVDPANRRIGLEIET